MKKPSKEANTYAQHMQLPRESCAAQVRSVQLLAAPGGALQGPASSAACRQQQQSQWQTAALCVSHIVTGGREASQMNCWRWLSRIPELQKRVL